MASLKLEHIYKVYPNGHKAVSDFNIDIKDGEFIVFVGPSGCGKSTTLRMIAGLEDISSGELYIGDTLVNDMQPKERDIAMVFQNYALYPHMTVYENMAFGLTLRKVPRTEIHKKVMWAAGVLGLTEYLDRKPKAMSGGQRQRVSLGRAILRNPKVMLLDEPLSNLDAKLRSQMRSEISKLHQQLKTTFIYVTHDQVEAMTLGTRVVVMKLGRVQQIDSPQALYDHPVNKFVAGFIGTPQMNFFNVTLKEEKDKVLVNWKDCSQKPLVLSSDQVLKCEKKFLKGDKDIILGFRCEQITAEGDLDGDNVVDVVVSHFEELGNETLIYGDLKEVEGLGNDSKTAVIIKATSKLGHKPGDIIKAKINVSNIHLFDAESEMTIIPLVPDHNVLPINIANEKMDLFGTESKPEAINVDYVKNGTISIPLNAIKVGEGKVKVKVLLTEVQTDKNIALVEVNGKKMYVFVDENVKKGDELTLSIDYSQATFRDEEEKIIASPLPCRDAIEATFVNLHTAFDATQNQSFMDMQNERIEAVNKKYEQIRADFELERSNALNLAHEKETNNVEEVAQLNEKIQQENLELRAQLASETKEYRENKKILKAKHAEIKKEEITKLNQQYRDMKAKEYADYKESMMKNKDPESRRARRVSFSIFKENLPLMKSSDMERKVNSLEFDKETDMNAINAKYNQTKSFIKDKIKQNKILLKKETKPVQTTINEYNKKEREIEKKYNDEILHAKLLFFFKYNDTYQLIPDFITEKIIQGLGNKVFTKVFRLAVPHGAYIEQSDGVEFKVVSFVNYGDVKLYKAVGEVYGERTVVYIAKDREMEIGEKIKLSFNLAESEIYEKELNIRLY